MKHHFDNLGSSLKSLDKYPTLLDEENRYKSCVRHFFPHTLCGNAIVVRFHFCVKLILFIT